MQNEVGKYEVGKLERKLKSFQLRSVLSNEENFPNSEYPTDKFRNSFIFQLRSPTPS